MIEKDLHDRLRNQNELDKRLLFDNAGDIGKHDGYADVGTIYSVKYDIISKKIEEESGRILGYISRDDDLMELLIEELSRLEELRDKLNIQYEEMQKETKKSSTNYNGMNFEDGIDMGAYGMMGALSLPLAVVRVPSLFRIVPILNVVLSIKERRYIQGYRTGYAENTKIQEEKLKELMIKSQENIKNLYSKYMDMENDISQIMNEIFHIIQQIENLYSRIVENHYYVHPSDISCKTISQTTMDIMKYIG